VNIRDYIGIPWKIDGFSKDEGFNCYSFVQYIQKVYFNIDTNDIPFDSYDRLSVMRQFKENEELNHWSKTNDPKDGDCVIMSESKRPSHVGVWVEDAVLHCVENVGVIFTKPQALKRMRWNILGYYRHG